MNVIGNLNLLPEKLQKLVQKAMIMTRSNTRYYIILLKFLFKNFDK